jgi:2-polyprenyl-6-methoxyphenol hydroxylase-like FAD-dependent oxidoreductase
MLGQDDNERIMGANLGTLGLAVEWNTELTALEQFPRSVKATLKGADGRIRTVVARYVAGCDGNHSAVRELTGIRFPGAPYHHVFFVADTEATGPMRPAELNMYLWKDGFHLFFPMRGKDRWRIVGILPEKLEKHPDLKFEDVIDAVRNEAGAALAFKSCSWFSTYRIQHRCTENFRKGRCFVLGDAAHVHSPMGGQGMNTGLQDAYNLAWKLALVIEGRADDALLDTYESERQRVAQRLLETTDRAFNLLVSTSWVAALFRTRVVARIAATMMRFEFPRRTAFRTLSMIGIRYPESPLSRAVGSPWKQGPKAGDRFPWLRVRVAGGAEREDLFARLDDTRFNLLVVGQKAHGVIGAAAKNSMLQLHEIPLDAANAEELARVGITMPAFYLLRPDGHIGLVGREFDSESVRSWFADASIRMLGAPRTPQRDSPQPTAVAARLGADAT